MLVSYLLPLLVARFHYKPQNLKKKYNAKWALVTGASSGIGRSISEKLAQQGLNIVLVALDDELLEKAFKELKSQYAAQEFRKVGCDLGKSDAQYDYMNEITKATKDINVQIIINNAGYLKLSAFIRSPLAAQVANLECNMMSHVKITHHFMSKMVENKLKGCITFTSSQAAFFPAPACTTYGGSKAFLQQFACNLAVEGYSYGIDICALMSGPMATNFYKGQPKLNFLTLAQSISDTPDTVADILLSSVGRYTVWRDASLMTIASRLVVKVVDMNLMIWAMARGQRFSSDFKNNPQLR